MRIAVAAMGKDEAAPTSPRTGRAPYFLIFDETGALIETVANPCSEGQRAGPRVAALLAKKKIDVLVGERFGGNLHDALSAAGIAMFEAAGDAQAAARQVKA